MSYSLNVPYASLLKKFQCKPNKCYCDHGVSAEFKSCPNDGLHECVMCDIGYHLTGSVCTVNECSCQNGIGATGYPRCIQHQNNYCAECLPGYHEVSRANNNNSESWNASIFCEKCPIGSEWNNRIQSCMTNKCRCEYGIPTSGDECGLPGTGLGNQQEFLVPRSIAGQQFLLPLNS